MVRTFDAAINSRKQNFTTTFPRARKNVVDCSKDLPNYNLNKKLCCISVPCGKKLRAQTCLHTNCNFFYETLFKRLQIFGLATLLKKGTIYKNKPTPLQTNINRKDNDNLNALHLLQQTG